MIKGQGYHVIVVFERGISTTITCKVQAPVDAIEYAVKECNRQGILNVVSMTVTGWNS